MRRDADDPLERWSGSTPDAVDAATAQTVTVFIDDDLVELFIEPAGLSVTAYVTGATAPGG